MPFYSAQERSDFRWSLPATKIQRMNGSALPDYNTIMRKRRIGWLPLAALILAIGISLIYYWSIPQVLEVSPSQNATAVQAGASIRVRFSRPMQHGGVESRLVTDPPRRGNFSWEENTLTFTPDQPWGSGETVQVRLEPGARSTGLLSMALRHGLSWTFTVRQPLLAYLYPSDASADIYLLDPSNGEITRLTDAPGTIMDYSVSLDGSVIYFNTEQGDGGSSIYGLNRNSGESRLLLECPGALCRYPQISPGGDFLAYERTDLSSPVRLNLPQVWLLPVSQDTSDGAPLPIGEPRLVAPPPPTAPSNPNGIPRACSAFTTINAQPSSSRSLRAGRLPNSPARLASRAPGILTLNIMSSPRFTPTKSQTRTPSPTWKPFRTATSFNLVWMGVRKTSPAATTWKTPRLPFHPMEKPLLLDANF